MHPFTAAELANQHQQELRDDAARARRAASLRRWRRGFRRRGRTAPAPRRHTPSDLAERLATFGPATLTIELRRFARDALRRGACPLLVSVVADPSQPDVARLRAFGRIIADLHQPTAPDTRDRRPDAA